MPDNNPNKEKMLASISTSLQLELEHPTSLSQETIEQLRNCQFSTKNCTLICGDNLPILKELCLGTIEPIDFCYIDPPYNTKNSFIYNDSRVSVEAGSFGSHANWMSFLLPRLVRAHSLLSESGIIAISIDDYEQPYLRLLLDRIFGEQNFLGNLVVCRSRNGRGSKKNISINHEYVLVYGKSKTSKILGMRDDISRYDKKDKHGHYRVDGLFRKKGDASKRTDRPNMFFPLYYDSKGNVFTENTTGDLKTTLPTDSKGVERRWLWGKEKTKKERWKLHASPKGVIYVKNYYSPEKRINVKSLWDDNKYLTERGTNQIKAIFGDKIFETPKPVELLEDLIFSHTSPDSLIIDFFAGTGTTAHAAHNLNELDDGTRKVILIEDKTAITTKHVAAKLGFKNISDITAKRLSYISKQSPNYKYSIIT